MTANGAPVRWAEVAAGYTMTPSTATRNTDSHALPLDQRAADLDSQAKDGWQALRRKRIVDNLQRA